MFYHDSRINIIKFIVNCAECMGRGEGPLQDKIVNGQLLIPTPKHDPADITEPREYLINPRL